MGERARSLIVRLGWLPLLAALALPAPAAAQMAPPVMRVVETPAYTVVLTIGPTEEMIVPGTGMMATSGEVMLDGAPMAPHSAMGGDASMAAPPSMANSMTMSTDADQGMMANHHLQVHLTRNDTGAVVQDVTPTIRITDKVTGISRDLPQVAAMYDMQMGLSDLHYGQNVWLPDGTYMVQVLVGSDRAEFRDVTVTGGAQMSMSGG